MVKQKAFRPSNVDKETSVFNLHPSDREAIWNNAIVNGRKDRQALAAAHLEAAALLNTDLEIFPDMPPPRHFVIRGWPFEGQAEDVLKARRMSLEQHLSSRATLLSK